MGLVNAGQIKSIANRFLIDSSVTKAVTYKSLSKSHSTSTGEVTDTTTSISTRGLFIFYTKWEIVNSRGAIQENDVRILIRAKAFEDESKTPKVGDRINDGSIDWEILDFEKIEVGSTGIMYEFHCRR